MSLGNFIKRIKDIMRKDKGVGTNDVLILEQLVWLLFLFIYEYKEQQWELHEDDYVSIIPEPLRWRNWAIDSKDGAALTGDALLAFINNDLLPSLKKLDIDETTERKKTIVQSIFDDANNYMKDGVSLRKLINVINEMDFDELDERHSFNDIYEMMLKDLQSAGNSGQYFTPRACTNFIAEMVHPKIGELVADLAAGTCGFLTSAMQILLQQAKTVEDREIINNSLYGAEKFHLPHLLGVTNLLLHGIDTPRIDHKNSFSDNIRDFREKDKFDIIIMNPPFGSKSEDASIKTNFPMEFQTSETADLFLALIMHRIKENGRVGLILPDGFLFGDDLCKAKLKEKLIKEFNLHTILRLPNGVFAPYTDINTNILFFDYNIKGTMETWYYEVPLPSDYKKFTKTKPMLDSHFDCVKTWWDNREESESCWKVSREDIVKRGYNLDIKNPNKPEEEVHDPEVLLMKYHDACKKVTLLQTTLIEELKKVL